MLIISAKLEEIAALKIKMKVEFEMTDLGELTYFLGLKFVRTKRGFVMHQKKYVNEVLCKFNMQACNPATVPIDTGTKFVKDEDEEGVDSNEFK